MHFSLTPFTNWQTPPPNEEANIFISDKPKLRGKPLPYQKLSQLETKPEKLKT